MKIKIGIPKSLLYYKYYDLWDTFFNELGCRVIYSPNSNKEILEDGKNLVVDESCLAMKINMGHIKYLVDKCDYILIPRTPCLKKDETTCTNFYALYDLCANLFDVKILNYNIDVERGETEKKGFMKVGLELGFKNKDIRKAYKKALETSRYEASKRVILNKRNLKKKDPLKILLVGHPYNVYDELVGMPIIKFLENENIEIIYAHQNDKYEHAYKKISKTLYWTFNKELVNGVVSYEKKVDGIILLTVFPCGPDSLVNEVIIGSVKKPIINIIIDELNSQTGLETRLESFVDILASSKGVIV